MGNHTYDSDGPQLPCAVCKGSTARAGGTALTFPPLGLYVRLCATCTTHGETSDEAAARIVRVAMLNSGWAAELEAGCP